MKSNRLATSLFAVLLVVLFAGTVLCRSQVEKLRGKEVTLEEVLYMPSGKSVKRLSLGYSSLLADIYWTRAVQYFGDKSNQRSMQYDLLYPLLDITTDLDPHLIVTYEFGSLFLSQPPPEGAGQPEKAVALVEVDRMMSHAMRRRVEAMTRLRNACCISLIALLGLGAAAPLASKVEGVSGPRRCGRRSPGFGRSAFGQASSNDAGGGSAGSGGGAAGGFGRRSADKRSGGNGSLVRACARSRSLRDVEENSRLRFGLAAASAAAASADASLREAASSCQGGGGGGNEGAAGSALPALSTAG